MAIAMACGWVGYIGSDDWVYIQNARARIDAPWLIGASHWAVRLPLTLPMAFSLAMFGESEFTAALPTLIYTWAAAMLVLLFLWKRVGAPSAVLASIFIAVAPLMTVNATMLRIDAVESFYVLASLLCFLLALEQGGSRSLFFLSGLIAGLAIVTRPTAVALLAFYGVLFLVGYGTSRPRYLLGFLGFLLVWLAESLYYFFGTGHWFYRLDIDFHHDQVVRAGTLFDAVVISPLRMLLTSHNLGLTFWMLFPLAWYAGRSAVAGERAAKLIRLLTLFAVVWIAVFSVFASKLILDPRYLTPALIASLMVVAIGCVVLYRHRRRTAVVIASAILLTQALGIYVENKDFIYESRWLVRLADQYQEPIYTDPMTRERALFLLQLKNSEDKTRAVLAPPGGLFLYVPRNAARGRYNLERWDPKDLEPGTWPVVETLAPEVSALASWLQSSGLYRVVPASVWLKMSKANPPVQLLRRPAD
jgi:hypothetical protein